MTNTERDARFVTVFDGVRTTPLVTVHPYTDDQVKYYRGIVRHSRDDRRVREARAWLDVRTLPYREGVVDSPACTPVRVPIRTPRPGARVGLRHPGGHVR